MDCPSVSQGRKRFDGLKDYSCQWQELEDKKVDLSSKMDRIQYLISAMTAVNDVAKAQDKDLRFCKMHRSMPRLKMEQVIQRATPSLEEKLTEHQISRSSSNLRQLDRLTGCVIRKELRWEGVPNAEAARLSARGQRTNMEARPADEMPSLQSLRSGSVSPCGSAREQPRLAGCTRAYSPPMSPSGWRHQARPGSANSASGGTPARVRPNSAGSLAQSSQRAEADIESSRLAKADQVVTDSTQHLEMYQQNYVNYWKNENAQVDKTEADLGSTCSTGLDGLGSEIPAQSFESENPTSPEGKNLLTGTQPVVERQLSFGFS
jgi:hypothetical protein